MDSKTREWFEEAMKRLPPVETRTFAGVTMRTSANFESMSFSHSWAISVFVVLAMLPQNIRLVSRTDRVDAYV